MSWSRSVLGGGVWAYENFFDTSVSFELIVHLSLLVKIGTYHRFFTDVQWYVNISSYDVNDFKYLS